MSAKATDRCVPESGAAGRLHQPGTLPEWHSRWAQPNHASFWLHHTCLSPSLFVFFSAVNVYAWVYVYAVESRNGDSMLCVCCMTRASYLVNEFFTGACALQCLKYLVVGVRAR